MFIVIVLFFGTTNKPTYIIFFQFQFFLVRCIIWYNKNFHEFVISIISITAVFNIPKNYFEEAFFKRFDISRIKKAYA